MTELPPGWTETTIGEACDIVNGSTPKTSVPGYWGGDIAWITPDDLSRHTGKLIDQGARSLTPEGYASCSTTLLPPGAVLFTSRAPIGYVAVANGPVCTNQGFKSLVPKDGVNSDYLYWHMRWLTPYVRSLGTGTTFAEVSKKAIAPVPLRLPPLAEQHRIVEAIEERLARLDAAEAALSQAQRRIELLADRLRVRAVYPPNVPEWPLAELSVLVTDGDHRPPPRVPHGVPHLTAKNVKHGRLILDGCSYLSEDGFEQTRRRYEPLEGDVIVTCVGTVGETAVVPPGLVFSADRNLAAVRVGDRLLPEYLRAVLATRSMRESLTVASGSTAQPHLYLKDLRRVRIPTPGIDEQREIVKQIESEMALIGHLSSSLERGRQRSVQLRRSILQRAFTGRLVPQDPSGVRAPAVLD